MARPAAEAPRGPFADLGALLRPAPGRAELAFRLALICALTTLVTEYYGTPEPALTAYIVFFLNRPERTTSLIFNMVFVLLITVVIGIVLLLAMWVVDAPAWRVATMAIVSLVFLFLASASKLRPIGPILAMIVAYALDLLGTVPMGELATRALLYVWLFIAIPAGVSLVVNLLAAPAPRRLAEMGLARRLRAAASGLEGADEAERRAFVRCRDTGVGEVLARLHLAGVERTLPPRDAAALTAAAHSTTAILFQVDALRADPTIPPAWRADAAAILREMASAFDKGGYPVRIAPTGPADSAGTSDLGRALMRDFGEALRRYAEPAAEPAKPEKKAGGFFLPDAFTNPEHWQYAFKTTGAAMFCYFLYVLLDWPGIHTCLITCYIVSLGTAAETVEKLSLRILGCLVGAAAGIAAIVWVMPALDTIWALMLVVFIGTLGAGWVAAGSPRIAYAGFQIAFAFFLCVIQGSGPAFDLTIARDRIIGILLGNAVTYLVFTRLWPVSVSRRIDPAIAGLLRQLGSLARMPRAGRFPLVPALQARMAAIRDDLALVRYEPADIRPADPWAAGRRNALQAVSGIEASLLLAGDHGFWNGIAHRLDHLAAQLAPASGKAPQHDEEVMEGVPTPDAVLDPLLGRARDQLAVLEQALAA